MKSNRNRYLLLEGAHIEHGKVYQKGAVIETWNELDVMFKNKFKKLGSEDVVPAGPAPTAENFTPSQGPAAGPIPAPPGPETQVRATDPSQPTADPAAGKKPAPKGRDVTERFPKAQEEDFKVYKNAGLYYVYDAEDLTKVRNAEGVDKAGVDKVIRDALEE